MRDIYSSYEDSDGYPSPELEPVGAGVYAENILHYDITAPADTVPCADEKYGIPPESQETLRLPDITQQFIAVVSAEVYQTACEELARTPRNTDKMSARRALLEDHPELRIRMDNAALQQIVPFLSFRCHPYCSVARDQAIKGSDIDRAVVIVQEMPGIEAREAFVGELRKQGFTAYTHEDAYVIGQAKGDASLWKAQGAVIDFRTLSEVEESLRTHPLDGKNLSIIAGYEVGAFWTK